jgi:hypothetical protein
MREVHGECVRSTLPRGILGPGDLAMPLEHVGGSIWVVDGLGHKAEGMVTAPLLSLLLEAVYHQLVYLLFLHYQIQTQSINAF